MHQRLLFAWLAILAGFICGPSSLEYASLSQPPIQWNDLLFVFCGSTISIFIVLGFQAAVGNNNALRRGWSMFSFIAIFLIATGISGSVTAFLRKTITPYSFLFLTLGCGLIFGEIIIRILFGKISSKTFQPTSCKYLNHSSKIRIATRRLSDGNRRISSQKNKIWARPSLAIGAVFFIFLYILMHNSTHYSNAQAWIRSSPELASSIGPVKFEILISAHIKNNHSSFNFYVIGKNKSKFVLIEQEKKDTQWVVHMN